MTSTRTAPTVAQDESLRSRTWWSVRNALVLSRRGVTRIIREPSQLLDVTVQPVIFILLFVYVFGSAIRLPGNGSYDEHLGLAVGWGIHNGIGDALAAVGLCLLIAFALTWAGACAGMLVKSPETATRGSRASLCGLVNRGAWDAPQALRRRSRRAHPGRAR
ncbi:MAG: hypothetical protein ACLP50_25115 [Solirubrobacteraceae bacterium]